MRARSTPTKEIPYALRSQGPVVKVEPPTDSFLSPNPSRISPVKTTQKPKRPRRKPMAIRLPPSMQDLDPIETKHFKNRISAARVRRREQEGLDELTSQLEHYKRRCTMLELVVAAQETEIELIPAVKTKEEFSLSDEDDATILGEEECAVLEEMLHDPADAIVEEQLV